MCVSCSTACWFKTQVLYICKIFFIVTLRDFCTGSCFHSLFVILLLQVLPTMEQYELDTFGRSHDIMSNFWNSCFDDLMSTAYRRDKDRSDSKSKFQVTRCLKLELCKHEVLACLLIDLTILFKIHILQEVIVDPYMKRVKSENARHLSWQKQSSGQQGVVWQHWKSFRRLLTSERGAWANRCYHI